jgi:hypothetical protein
MKDLALLAISVAVVLITVGTAFTVPPQPATISPEALHRQVDVSRLPTVEVAEPF